ncbi:hypothetical protein DBV05_g8761 [Lasiodiplodia theobromae]|uniref:Uncharacterized protein n=1 Tax=Lasiodiplodia theobromae TaxID=45133 RepID=A0A5N5D4G0_9PEZI|nr:hypothetical protein DBV05_g8761 [Lasiodiplodia theobromae]
MDGNFEFPIPTNVTTSYGVLFIAALLSASSVRKLSGSQGYNDGDSREDLGDQTYNIRDRTQVINTDFMTYAMYAMSNKDPQRLLDPDTHRALAERTFATFFQHFVSSNVSLDTGSWAYQPINASLPSDMLCNFTDPSRNASYERALHPNSSTPRQAVVQVSTPVDLLEMNTVAVALSVAILIWLVIITAVVSSVQRHPSPVSTPADPTTFKTPDSTSPPTS